MGDKKEKDLKLRYLLPLLFIGTAHAAPWERPAGSYTPTNHSVNITKYQTDSANHIAISSAKLDGDMNKAFQGLNDLDSRTPPSVTGNAGKFLTNDGTAASWGLVSNTSMSSSGATAGYILQANGIGGVGWGQVSASALGNSGVVSGTYPFASIQVNSGGLVVSASGVATPTMAGLTVNGTITATTISASTMILGGVSITSWPLTKCATSSDLTIPGSFSSTAFTHGLGVTPTIVSYWLRNTSAELGFTVGETTSPVAGTNSGSSGFSIVQNATSTTIIWGVAPTVLNKSNGTNTAITAAKWVMVVKECI